MKRALVVALLALGCGGAEVGETLPPPGNEAIRELALGARALNSGRLTRAERRLRRAIERAPNLWEAHYDLALVHERRGELEEAAAALAEARRLAPEASAPLFAQATLAARRGELSHAADALRELLGRTPDDRRVRLTLARVLRQDEEYSDALAEVRELLVRDPRDVEALVEIARIDRARGRLEVARLVLEKAREVVAGADEASELRPALLAEIANERGLLELERDDTQAAFEAFEDAIAAQPSFVPARLNMGTVMLYAGNYAGAREQFEAALEVEGEHLGARLGRAVALRGLGEFPRARRAYAQILETHPEQPDALLDLAILKAEFLDERTASRELFRRFLSVAPTDHPGRELAQRYLQDIPAAGETGAQ